MRSQCLTDSLGIDTQCDQDLSQAPPGFILLVLGLDQEFFGQELCVEKNASNLSLAVFHLGYFSNQAETLGVDGSRIVRLNSY
jgi:hypothetical protein